MALNAFATVLLTNDVETTSIAYGILSDEAGKLVSEQGLPRLLELYDKFNIKSTFFLYRIYS
jgi:peptidoglycan/xylan/chitin deacetylase (PgdA/CDA1 family)